MFGFIIAFVAGFLTPHVEAPLTRPVAKALSKVIDIQDNEMRLLSFLLMLLVAAILCAIFNTGSSLGLIIGATLGYFALRILSGVQAIMDARKG